MTGTRLALIATHLAPARGYGGVAESTARLAREWAAAGLGLEVCTSDASMGGRLRPEDMALGPRVRVRLYRAHWFRRWGFGLGAPAAIWAVCRRADAVYISGIATWPTTLAALACIVLGRPFVVAPRGGLLDKAVADIRESKPHKLLYYHLLTLPALRRAKALHATSGQEAEQLRRRFPGMPVEVVVNGLGLDDWAPLPPRTPDGGLSLCFIGRLTQQKGIEDFARSWLAVAGPDDRLTVVGSGPREAELRSLAESSGGRMVMTGYRDRAGIRAVLAVCDALVLPSSWENFGNAIAESLASARPVLVTRGLCWDHLEEEGAGLVLGDGPRAQAESIRRLAALSPQRRAAMGAAARAYAEVHFDLRVSARRLADLLQPDLGAAPRHHSPGGGG